MELATWSALFPVEPEEQIRVDLVFQVKDERGGTVKEISTSCWLPNSNQTVSELRDQAMQDAKQFLRFED